MFIKIKTIPRPINIGSYKRHQLNLLFSVPFDFNIYTLLKYRLFFIKCHQILSLKYILEHHKDFLFSNCSKFLPAWIIYLLKYYLLNYTPNTVLLKNVYIINFLHRPNCYIVMTTRMPTWTL